MRKVLFLALLLSPAIAFCADKHMPTGKWKEVKRIGPGDNSPIAYTDTIHIEFLIGGEYVWQKQGGFIYRGTYKLSDKDLDLGMRDFSIVSKTPTKLVVKDETGTYEFVPDHSVATTATLPQDGKPKPVGSIDLMVGHWSVYKSNSDKQQSSIDYSRKVKMIDITGGSSDGKLGYIYSTHDADNTPSWTVDSYSNQTLHCSGKDSRTFNVLKCENNELILEEGGMTYFFKQFK